MENGTKSTGACSLKFERYFVDLVEFKRNNNFINSSAVSIDLNLGSDIEFINDNKAYVKLFLKIFDDDECEKVPFTMKINITGVFVVDNPETDKFLIEQNALAILFPYVRALVTTYTANSNVTPLILQPINIVNYIEHKKKLIEENTEKNSE